MFCIKRLFNLSYNSYQCLQIVNQINVKLLSRNLNNCNHQFVKCLSTVDKKSNEENDQNSEDEDKDIELPQLMKFRPKGMPNIFNTIKNQFIINFQLKPNIDREFNINTFLNGAKHALTVISSHLANDNIEGLKGLVTDQALEEISKNFSTFTSLQKQQLKVLLGDILLCFAYSIQIEKESSAPDKSIVRIFVVYDCFKNIEGLLKEDIKDGKAPIFNFNKYFDRKYLCNYEFTREYRKGEESHWIVSKLMHIKDKDILKMYGLFKR